MLNSIRKAADSLIFRIILGIIVIAFAFWGVDDILRSRNNFDLVTFKHAKAISEEEFAKAKAREISMIQQSQNINLSEEQIKQYGINEVVLDRLVSHRLLDLLVDQYNVDFGDKTLADFIKQQDTFKNKEGKFDMEIFKFALKNSGMTEEGYALDTKEKLVRSALLSAFVRASYVSDASVNNIAEFMSEERVCDIASIDLSSTKLVASKEPSEQQLREFYKSKAEYFTLPEKRSISYVVLDEGAIKKDIKISEGELKKFFEENKEEFGDKPNFAKVKEQIDATLKSRKADELLVEFAKNLEDEVAAGTSLKEIAANFKLKTIAISNVTAEGLAANKTIGTLSNNIFAMHAGEVSYPLELPSSKTMALVEVNNIMEAQLQDMEKIRASVIQKWKSAEAMNTNIKIMQDFAASSKPQNFKENAVKLGLTINLDTKLKRAELGDNEKLPPEMLTAIFNADSDTVSQVYSSGDKAFVALIRIAKHNADTKKTILKESGENIAEQIRNSLVQEIMGYLKNKENAQVNIRDKILQ